MVYAFEIVGLLFAAVMVYLTRLEFKRKRLSNLGYAFWNIIWVLAIAAIIFHSQVNSILPKINIFRVFDLYTILAFMFLFVVIFYLFIKIKHVERRVEEVTRLSALKGLK